MAYRALNEETMFRYLRSRPAIARRFPRGADLSVKEVGDGNLNSGFIFPYPDEPGYTASLIFRSTRKKIMMGGQKLGPAVEEQTKHDADRCREQVKTLKHKIGGLIMDIEILREAAKPQPATSGTSEK